MSKKHFIALADALRRSKPELSLGCADSISRLAQWNADVTAIADECKRENYAFNRQRWLGYINGDNGPSGGAR